MFVKVGYLLDVVRTLGNESALLQQREDVCKVIVLCELLNILKELMLWNADKRIANPGPGQRAYLLPAECVHTLP